MPDGFRDRRVTKSVLIGLVALTVGACDGTPSTTTGALESPATTEDVAELIEGLWLFEAMEVHSEPVEVETHGSDEWLREGVPMWLLFTSQGDVSGKGPCNSLNGEYVVDGGRLHTELGISLALCDEITGSTKVMEDEEEFLTPFGPEIDPAFPSDDELVISGDGVTLRFRRGEE